MTKAQIELLQRLLAADRYYRSMEAAGKPVPFSARRVEICPVITGFHRRTASALEEAGLAEIVQENPHGPVYAYLGKANPYEDVSGETAW